MKKENKKSENKSLYILFTSIILILILFLFGFLLINKREQKKIIKIENNEIIKNNDYIEDALHIKKKGKYTGYCKLGLTHYLDINVKYPKLKLKKKNAIKLNDIILNDNKNIVDFILDNNVDINDNKNKTTLYINTSYNYLVKDNILYIVLESNYLFDNNNNYPHIKNYFYDINNDEILDFKTGLAKANLNLDDYKKIDKNNIINSLDENTCKLKIKNGKLIPYILEN